MPMLEPKAVILTDFETGEDVEWTWEHFLATTQEQLLDEAGGDRGDNMFGKEEIFPGTEDDDKCFPTAAEIEAGEDGFIANEG